MANSSMSGYQDVVLIEIILFYFLLVSDSGCDIESGITIFEEAVKRMFPHTVTMCIKTVLGAEHTEILVLLYAILSSDN